MNKYSFLFICLLIVQLSALKSIYDTDVIIIGAGVSGIAASSQLSKLGISNFIIEGRDRIGGRIYTNSEAFGYPIDIGAIFITDQHDNPLLKLAAKYKQKLTPFDFENDSYHISDESYNTFNSENPQYNSKTIVKEMDNSINEFFKFMKENFDRLKDNSIKDAINTMVNERKLSLLKKLEIFFSASFLQCDLTRPLKILKDFNFLKMKHFGEKFSIANEGYINLIKPLTKNMNIKLNTKVSQVIQENDHVTIIDSENKQYTSKYAIVTVSLGVLKSGMIAFTPELSMKKKKSLESQAMFDMNKVFVEFEEKFWDDYDIESYLINYDLLIYDFVVNLHNINGKNVLIFMVSGEKIDILAQKSDEVVKSEILSLLTTFYPSATIKITNLLRSNWKNDIFSQGSFSEFYSGPDYRRELIEPEGRIIFAGEHTSLEYNACVYGAFMSGLRAAVQIKSIVSNHKGAYNKFFK